MGIVGLHKQLKFCTKKGSVREFRGQRIAVDASSWLHKSVYSISSHYVECYERKRIDEKCIAKSSQYILSRCKELLTFAGITSIHLVMDGKRCPLKAATNNDREERRRDNLNKARDLKRRGLNTESEEKYKACIKVGSELTQKVMARVERLAKNQQLNILFVWAPYEADAQMVKVCMEGGADAIVTEDSDVLVYLAACLASFPVLFKLERQSGACDIVSMDWLLNKKMPPQLEEGNRQTGFNSDRKKSSGFESIVKHLIFRESTKRGRGARLFVQGCCLAGCDYAQSLTGIGLVNAFKLVREHSAAEDVFKNLLRSLPKKAKKNVDLEHYKDILTKSEAVFYYHPVKDPDKTITTLQAPSSKEETANSLLPGLHKFNGDLSFLGDDDFLKHLASEAGSTAEVEEVLEENRPPIREISFTEETSKRQHRRARTPKAPLSQLDNNIVDHESDGSKKRAELLTNFGDKAIKQETEPRASSLFGKFAHSGSLDYKGKKDVRAARRKAHKKETQNPSSQTVKGSMANSLELTKSTSAVQLQRGQKQTDSLLPSQLKSESTSGAFRKRKEIESNPKSGPLPKFARTANGGPTKGNPIRAHNPYRKRQGREVAQSQNSRPAIQMYNPYLKKQRSEEPLGIAARSQDSSNQKQQMNDFRHDCLKKEISIGSLQEQPETSSMNTACSDLKSNACCAPSRQRPDPEQLNGNLRHGGGHLRTKSEATNIAVRSACHGGMENKQRSWEAVEAFSYHNDSDVEDVDEEISEASGEYQVQESPTLHRHRGPSSDHGRTNYWNADDETSVHFSAQNSAPPHREDRPTDLRRSKVSGGVRQRSEQQFLDSQHDLSIEPMQSRNGLHLRGQRRGVTSRPWVNRSEAPQSNHVQRRANRISVGNPRDAIARSSKKDWSDDLSEASSVSSPGRMSSDIGFDQPVVRPELPGFSSKYFRKSLVHRVSLESTGNRNGFVDDDDDRCIDLSQPNDDFLFDNASPKQGEFDYEGAADTPTQHYHTSGGAVCHDLESRQLYTAGDNWESNDLFIESPQEKHESAQAPRPRKVNSQIPMRKKAGLLEQGFARQKQEYSRSSIQTSFRRTSRTSNENQKTKKSGTIQHGFQRQEQLSSSQDSFLTVSSPQEKYKSAHVQRSKVNSRLKQIPKRNKAGSLQQGFERQEKLEFGQISIHNIFGHSSRKGSYNEYPKTKKSGRIQHGFQRQEQYGYGLSSSQDLTGSPSCKPKQHPRRKKIGHLKRAPQRQKLQQGSPACSEESFSLASPQNTGSFLRRGNNVVKNARQQVLGNRAKKSKNIRDHFNVLNIRIYEQQVDDGFML